MGAHIYTQINIHVVVTVVINKVSEYVLVKLICLILQFLQIVPLFTLNGVYLLDIYTFIYFSLLFQISLHIPLIIWDYELSYTIAFNLLWYIDLHIVAIYAFIASIYAHIGVLWFYTIDLYEVLWYYFFYLKWWNLYGVSLHFFLNKRIIFLMDISFQNSFVFLVYAPSCDLLMVLLPTLCSFLSI